MDLNLMKWIRRVKSSHLSKPRAPHLTRGRHTEYRALRFLNSRGLKLIESNFRCRFGEIDLIMDDGEYVVFVEVRFRKNANFGGAAASIGATKMRRLRSTAEYYLQNNPPARRRPCRFDVILVSETSLDWIRNAL